MRGTAATAIAMAMCLEACGGSNADATVTSLDGGQGDGARIDNTATTGGAEGAEGGARTIVSLDAAAAACAQDWLLAEKPETWCSVPPYDKTPGAPPTATWWNVALIQDCMGYNVVIANQVDNGIACIYESAGAKLVGVAAAAGMLELIAGELPFNDVTVCGDALRRDNLCVPPDASGM